MTEVIKNNLKLLIVSALTLLGLMFVPAMASAQATPPPAANNASNNASTNSTVNTENGVRCGSDINFSGGSCAANTQADDKIQNLVRTIINIFSVVVGAVCVIMIVIGGFRYVTSGGDSNNVGAAKNTILYAIVGLIIVAVSQVIVQFVLQRTT